MAAKPGRGDRNKPTTKPLSLEGMSPEDALRKALSTPPPKPAKKTAGKRQQKDRPVD